MKEHSQETINDLVGKLNRALKAYESGNIIMSDYEYDNLILQLRHIDPNNNFLNKISNQGGDFTHTHKMLSLDKVHDLTVLSNWLTKEKYLCSFKMDGVAISIHYTLANDDYFYITKAATRGNGSVGKDITDIIFGLDIPNKIKKTKETFNRFEVRGESVIHKDMFDILKIKNPEFITPRNLVAGSLNTIKDPNILERRHVVFYAYNIIADTIYTNIQEDARISTKFNRNFKYLQTLGFNVVPHLLSSNMEDIFSFIVTTEDRRYALKYDIDGVVLVLNTVSRYLEKGFTDHHPKGAIAFKFKPDIKKASIVGIDWQVGRTGILTPVANLNPIEINNVTVRRATLHNYTFLTDNKFHIDDEVEIQRSGDVIPKINRNLTKHDEKDSSLEPKICPECKNTVELISSESSGQLNYMCLNVSCKGVLIYKILNWLRVLDVKGLGTQLITKLVKRRFVKSISDLYSLSTVKYMKIEKIQMKSAQKYFNALHNDSEITTAQFIAALGINGIGLSMAEKISKHFNDDLEDIIDANSNDFIQVDGVGDILSDNLEKYFAYNIEEINNLLCLVKISNDVITTKEKDGIAGLNFCISGKVQKGKIYYYNLIESFGGNVTGVNKNLNILVSNETATSKVQKAREYGIKIISEDDLNRLFYS